jgi:hypothetical protein
MRSQSDRKSDGRTLAKSILKVNQSNFKANAERLQNDTKRSQSDFEAIAKRVQRDCITIAKRFRSDCKTSAARLQIDHKVNCRTIAEALTKRLKYSNTKRSQSKFVAIANPKQL